MATEPIDARLVGRWKPEESRGEIVNDLSGHGFAGKVVHEDSNRDESAGILGSVRKVAFLLHLVDLKVLCTKGRQRFGGGYHAAASTH